MPHTNSCREGTRSGRGESARAPEMVRHKNPRTPDKHSVAMRTYWKRRKAAADRYLAPLHLTYQDYSVGTSFR
jgi:hypothetical protein